MQKEIVEAYPNETMAIYVIWVPMIPSDNEAAARRTSTMYADARLRQFYDPGRLTGIAFSREVKPDQYKAMIDPLPAEHPLKQHMTEWLAKAPEERPVWDVVYTFPPGVRWTESLPKATFWTKQVGFFGDQPGDESSGLFFRHDSKEPPVESDWFVELRVAMQKLVQVGGSGK